MKLNFLQAVNAGMRRESALKGGGARVRRPCAWVLLRQGRNLAETWGLPGGVHAVAVLVYLIFFLVLCTRIIRVHQRPNSRGPRVTSHASQTTCNLVDQPNGAVLTEWRRVFGVTRKIKSGGGELFPGSVCHCRRVRTWQMQASYWVYGEGG